MKAAWRAAVRECSNTKCQEDSTVTYWVCSPSPCPCPPLFLSLSISLLSHAIYFRVTLIIGSAVEQSASHSISSSTLLIFCLRLFSSPLLASFPTQTSSLSSPSVFLSLFSPYHSSCTPLPAVQCKSMGIQSKWEEVLDAYRDVNKLFGDIIKVSYAQSLFFSSMHHTPSPDPTHYFPVRRHIREHVTILSYFISLSGWYEGGWSAHNSPRADLNWSDPLLSPSRYPFTADPHSIHQSLLYQVTPSSKCVGDLALYLVTRSLTTTDLLDPSKASSIDFPESVVGWVSDRQAN